MSKVAKCNATEFVFREGETNVLTEAPWSLKQDSSGPQVTALNSFLRYQVENQQGRNKWVSVNYETPLPLPKGGMLISFSIRVSEISGSEVKFNCPNGIILRFTSNGNHVMYNYWNGRFNDLAASSIRATGDVHDIVIVVQESSTSLYEDGKFMFNWEKQSADVGLNISAQALDVGSNMLIDRGNIYTTSLTKPIPQYKFVEGGDAALKEYPWDLQVQDGPNVETKDGYLHYYVQNQRVRNQWVFLKLVDEADISGGLSLNIRIRAPMVESSEVKFTLPGGVILRFTHSGSSGKYMYWQSGSGFHELASSGVTTNEGENSKWHSLSIVYHPKSTTLYEDGEELFKWDKDNGPSLTMTFHMQALDTGSNLQFDMSNIELADACSWKQ